MCDDGLRRNQYKAGRTWLSARSSHRPWPHVQRVSRTPNTRHRRPLDHAAKRGHALLASRVLLSSIKILNMGALAESGSADGYYYAGRAPALRAHHLPTPSRRRAAELWNFGGPGQTRVGLGCGRTRVVLSRSLGGQVYVLIVDVDDSPRPQGEGATGRKWTDISGRGMGGCDAGYTEIERGADDTASRKEGDGICLVLSRLIRVWSWRPVTQDGQHGWWCLWPLLGVVLRCAILPLCSALLSPHPILSHPRENRRTRL